MLACSCLHSGGLLIRITTCFCFIFFSCYYFLTNLQRFLFPLHHTIYITVQRQYIISILSLNTHVRTRHKYTYVILNAKKSCNLIANSRGYNLKLKNILLWMQITPLYATKKWKFLQQGNSNINTHKFISKIVLSHFFSVVEFIPNKRSIHFPN